MPRYYRHRFKSQLRSEALLRLFFDFYALNEIWFRTLGAAEYGYPVTRILPFAKEQAINQTFKNKVEALKNQVIHALEQSVRGEIMHWGCETHDERGGVRSNKQSFWGDYEVVPGTSIFDKMNARIGYDNNWGYSQRKEFFSKLPLEAIHSMYALKIWYRHYGGKRWAEATRLLIQLKDSKTLKDDIYLIDRIFDLQHNTGFILNKTVFATLDSRERVNRKHKNGRWYYVKPLNYRFTASLHDLVRYASSDVRGLYTANLRMVTA